MKLIRSISLFIIMSFIIVSCGLDKSFVQKRKYNKGYYISIAKKNMRNGHSITPSEKINDSKELNIESTLPQKEECISQKNENMLIQDVVSINKKDNKSNNSKKNKTNKLNDVVQINKAISHKFKGISAINKEINNNTSSVRPNKSVDSDLINLILAVVLVIAIIMLLSFLDGLLGGLLSLILLIVIIVLLLSYFGII